jgi:hypothetical protein
MVAGALAPTVAADAPDTPDAAAATTSANVAPVLWSFVTESSSRVPTVRPVSRSPSSEKIGGMPQKVRAD